MKQTRRAIACILGTALLVTLLSSCGGVGANKEPTAITIWHYYNGAQQQKFNEMVDEFNETLGVEKGIVVEAHSYGGVGDLTEKVLDAVYGKVGAEHIPDVFSAYADTAYETNVAGKVADISQYLTKEEQEQYLASYLDEGRFEGDEGFKIFPIAKSTELLLVNQTEWSAFSAATGASKEGFTTWEGVAALAEQYYDWTDAKTPGTVDDGSAFFGRDAFANYIIIGSKQLGTELFSVENGKVTLQIDKAVMRRLWDNFYVPYISGAFASYGNFRSDDMRTGDIVALVGSSSGATYFPSEVTEADGKTSPIEGAVYPLPNFQGTAPMAVQQGAGMVVTKSTPERERAAVTFLKWFTQPEQNIRFSIASGYLPVTYAANDKTLLGEAIGKSSEPISAVLAESLNIGVEMAKSYTLYTNKAFENGYEARGVVEKSMQDQAKLDRQGVEALMEGGASREAAIAQFNTDAHFEEWLTNFSEALAAAAGV